MIIIVYKIGKHDNQKKEVKQEGKFQEDNFKELMEKAKIEYQKYLVRRLSVSKYNY